MEVLSAPQSLFERREAMSGVNRRASSLTAGSLPLFGQLSTIAASPLSTPSVSSSSVPGQHGAGTPQIMLHESVEQPEKENCGPSRNALFIAIPAPPNTPRIALTIPPTPPAARFLVRSATGETRRSTNAVSPSASFPLNSLPPHASLKADVPLPKRRASLPAMRLTKPLPPTPNSPSSPSKTYRLSKRPLQSIDNNIPILGRLELGSIRPRTLFRLGSDNFSDNDDDDLGEAALSVSEEGPENSQREGTQEGSSTSEHLSDEKLAQTKQKDDLRRYHALRELLSSEALYLENLRALVTIYLRQLPMLLARTSAPPSHFGSSTNLVGVSTFSRSPSTAVMASAFNARTIPTTSPVDAVVLPAAGPSKQPKHAPRYLFSELDIEVVNRNADEILHLHEHFVEGLRAAVAPLGINVQLDDGGVQEDVDISQVDAAVEIVMTKFTVQASQFNAYESFCSGHTQAFDLVRNVSSAHVVEWEAFERRCSTLITEMDFEPSEDHASILSEGVSGPPSAFSHTGRPAMRRHSLSSLEVPDRSLRGQPSSRGLRLAFMDYMILPVQRICRYPLLLEQLKTGKAFRRNYSGSTPRRMPHIGTDVNVVVESATQAMRHVASAVDEARRKQDVSTQSSLIVSRIALASSAQLSLTSTASRPAFYSLTPYFLISLGACLLAGSLDIMHYGPYSSNHSTVKAKYLASFLYMGGYLILAKVNKGKVYEPRHWFTLTGSEIIDVTERDALLPYSIRIIQNGHHFELAASCQREKEAWLQSVRESLTVTPAWTNEPTSSLLLDGKGEAVASPLDDAPYEAIVALPTIQSIPTFDPTGEVADLTPSLSTKTTKSKSHSLPPTSRRSSTASVKAMFTPAEATIRRSTTAARAVIDRGLLDVISEPCLSARSNATLRDGELFRASKVLRAPRPTNGLTMAGAKAARNKRESLFVPKRKSFIGCSTSTVPEDPAIMPAGSRMLTGLRTRSGSKKLPSVPPLSLPPIPTFTPSVDRFAVTDLSMSNSPELLPETPSGVQSPLGSPLIMPTIAPEDVVDILEIPRKRLLSAAEEPDYRPKRTRSMVDGVRGFFASSTSPRRAVFDLEHSRSTQHLPAPSPASKWWKPDSLRRRVRSAPDPVADAEPGAPLKIAVEGPPVLPDLIVHEPLTSPATTPYDSSVVRHQLRDVSQPAGAVAPARRRSVFIPSSFRRPLSETEATISRKVQRNFSLLNKLSPLHTPQSHNDNNKH